MLFSSENNCNSSIESIIKNKITLINNNNNINNNNLINSNLNNSTLINQLTSKLDKNFKFNNQNANLCLCQPLCSQPSSPSCGSSNLSSSSPLLFSPLLENENAKEIIQQKILDNALIAQQIKEQNQELVNYLANINENQKVNEIQEVKNNVLLSPIDLELISNSSNELLINNGVNVNNDIYVAPNVSFNSLMVPQQNIMNQNALLLNPVVYSPESQNSEDLTTTKSSEMMNLESILNSPNAYLTAPSNQPVPYMSTPESSVLSSPLSNNLMSSPESNVLSSPELYDTLSVDSPELNLNNNSSVIDNTILDNYLLNQELLKLQQKSLMNSELLSNMNQINSLNGQLPLFDNNLLISSPETTPELLNQTFDLTEPATINASLENEINIDEILNGKRKFDEEEEEEDNGEESEIPRKKSKKENNVINEGKPFIYVVTESDNEEENERSSQEEDGQKKKKYKKKLYVCSVCGHKSKRHYNVEVHLKTHEENRERPFECEICKKSFCRSHDLERHKVIHKEKMFSCELCHKKFGRLDSLKRHMGCKTCVKRQQLLKKE